MLVSEFSMAMNRCALLYVAFLCVLPGCGGPFGKWEPTSGPFVKEKTYPELIETVTRDGVQYQIEHSGAHPSLSWAVGPNRLAAIQNDVADSMTYGDIFTLQGYRYAFREECEGIVKVGDEKYGALESRRATLRVLEYADKETMYIFRDVDMNGRKFKTFIVVASWQKPTGNYVHWIEQQTNELNEIKYCLE